MNKFAMLALAVGGAGVMLSGIAPGAIAAEVVQTSTTCTNSAVVSPGPETRIMENRMILPAPTPIEFLTSPTARSDYDERLSGILDQINLAADKGWLDSGQVADLQSWQSDILKEEAAMRRCDGGVVSRADADRLEKHVTGLAYFLSKQLNK